MPLLCMVHTLVCRAYVVREKNVDWKIYDNEEQVKVHISSTNISSFISVIFVIDAHMYAYLRGNMWPIQEWTNKNVWTYIEHT